MLYDKIIEISKYKLDRERQIDPNVDFVYLNLDIVDKYGKIIIYGLSDEFESEKVLQ